jgi:hypothetical protein
MCGCGATFFDDPEFTILSSFESAIWAGSTSSAPGGTLRLFYEESFGDLVEKHAAGVKGGLPF